MQAARKVFSLVGLRRLNAFMAPYEHEAYGERALTSWHVSRPEMLRYRWHKSIITRMCLRYLDGEVGIRLPANEASLWLSAFKVASSEWTPEPIISFDKMSKFCRISQTWLSKYAFPAKNSEFTLHWYKTVPTSFVRATYASSSMLSNTIV